MSDCIIVVRNADGTRRGELSEFASFRGGPRVNEVGTAQVAFDWNHPLLPGLLSSRSEMAVLRASDGFELFGGPVDENSLTLDASAGTAELTVKEQTQWLNWRLCLPNMNAQTATDIGGLIYVDAYGMWIGADAITDFYSQSGRQVSTIIRTLVDYSVGERAYPLRRVASFVLADDPLLGPVLTGVDAQVAFADGMVGPVVNTMAARYGLVLAMLDGEFTIREAADLSGSVIFATDHLQLPAVVNAQMHSLAGYNYRVAPPAGTVAWTASDVDGSNVNRDIVLAFDETLLDRWGWIEVFDNEDGIARPGTVPAAQALQAAGETHLTSLQGSESLSMTTIEGPVYGIDYQLGDIVGVQLTADLLFAGQVTGLDITADADGWRLNPALGDRVLLKSQRTVPRVLDLLTRVGRLEGA